MKSKPKGFLKNMFRSKANFCNWYKNLKIIQNKELELAKTVTKLEFLLLPRAKAKVVVQELLRILFVAKETVYLLSIYDKSDQETLSAKELDELLKYVSDDNL